MVSVPLRQRVVLGVVTFNNPPAHLCRLVRSIDLTADRLDASRHDAILVTIDCGDPAEWPHSRVPQRRLPSQGNLGFGGGMNLLLAEAFSDAHVRWFLCVNPDGLLHRDLLVEMIRMAEVYPDSLLEARQFPEEHPKPYDPHTGVTLWASGACLLIPRRIYETIGGFDPNIFMYMEDVDLSWRARAAGFTIRVAPRALFGHSVLDRQPSLLIEKYYYFSARYLAYKWGNTAEQAFLESVIRERRYVEELPPLPKISHPTAFRPADSSPAQFEYGFAFAPLRWC